MLIVRENRQILRPPSLVRRRPAGCVPAQGRAVQAEALPQLVG